MTYCNAYFVTSILHIIDYEYVQNEIVVFEFVQRRESGYFQLSDVIT
jgi:hypothetical protein